MDDEEDVTSSEESECEDEDHLLPFNFICDNSEIEFFSHSIVKTSPTTMNLKERIKNVQKQRKRRLKLSASKKRLERENANKRMKNFRKRRTDENENNLDELQKKFCKYLSVIHWKECLKCNKIELVDKTTDKKCKNCDVFHENSDYNPGPVPLELKRLKYVERLLVARLHTVLSVYRIEACQYGYKGNIINFPQNVQDVADILPHKVNDLLGIITIRLDLSDSYIDFDVRRDVVEAALVWLIKYNPFYRNVTISKENLMLLPENKNVYQEMRGYNEIRSICPIADYESGSEDSDDDTIEFSELKNDKGDDGVIITDVPNNEGFSQEDHIKHSFGKDGSYPWPTIEKVPISEFESPGYFTMAFPHLYPYGKGDLSILKQDKKVSLTDYIKYIMQYNDGRFAKDERFRYFLMNTIMRWSSLSAGSVFVKNNDIFSTMTVAQLRSHMKTNPMTAKQIMFYSTKLRTTRPYWNARCGELLDMVHGIKKPPTVFFTLSSADYHWPELYNLLGFQVTKLTLSEKRQIISENPLLFDFFFVLRATYFVEHIFKQKFKVTDFWYRFEYQHRGSIHMHGIAWFRDAPNVNDISTNEKQLEILKYFDELISCQNPNVNCEISQTHPCSQKLDEVIDHQKDYIELINRVQRHTKCSEKFCMQKNGKLLQRCKYKFPFELKERSELVIEDNQIKDIIFKRNDPLMNKHNRWLSRTWRGNSDFAPIYNETSIYHYIAKYASKCEIKSKEYKEILSSITETSINDNESCKTAIRKLLIRSCSERDYCAQEVVHYLMGFPFYRSSRQFVVLNAKHFSWDTIDNSGKRTSFLKNYIDRPTSLTTLSLYEFSRDIYVKKGSYHKRHKKAIVRVFPRFTSLKDEQFQKEEISTLYAFFVPWSSLDDLKVSSIFKEIEVEKRKEIICEYLFKKSLEEIKSQLGTENENREKSWKRFFPEDPLSSYNPMKQTKVSPLGKREIDLKHNWNEWCHELSRDTLNELIEKIQTDSYQPRKFNVSEDDLNESQLKVMNHLKQQVQSIQNKTKTKGSVAIIQGGAGTGKSFTLKNMYNYIFDNLGPEAVMVMSPTGSAANLVNGTTINAGVKLPRRFNEMTSLVGDDLVNFQKKGKAVEFILCDEYSMVGCRMLAAIEMRLKELKDSTEPFGNLYIYLFGDCHQLVPSGDSPFYSSIAQQSDAYGLLGRGKVLVQTIEKAFFLTVNHRSNNSSYCDFLERLSMGNCTESDVKEVNARCYTVLNKKELEKFKNVTKVCALNATAEEHNSLKIQELNKPIALVEAQNNSKTAFLSSVKEAGGLVNTLYLCEGALVVLKRNLNVTRGLVNGAVGEIYKVLFESNKGPPSVPAFVLIKFFNVNLSGIGVDYVPIKPMLTTWEKSGQFCSRFQLPIMLAWSCTIHRAQGMGLTYILLDLGDSEFQCGLVYTAFSRVSTFESLCLTKSITLKRLNSIRRLKRYIDINNFIEWLSSKVD